jgi:hypothetical protein
MAQNGRLPASSLAPIAGGKLAKGAAAAWNAMNVEARRRYGVELRPTGSRSSYRTYADQQHFWQLYQAGKGALAARPGTSNHGLGLAVDVPTQRMRQIIDAIGAKYGWAKKWSDAPSEWWHLRYKAGVYKGANPGPTGKAPAKPAKPKPPAAYPGHVLKRGSKGTNVKKLQQRLKQRGWKITVDSTFGPRTELAVRGFQGKNRLHEDGIVGPATWKKLFG